jgi:Rhodopirellula transposase DDE domain
MWRGVCVSLVCCVCMACGDALEFGADKKDALRIGRGDESPLRFGGRSGGGASGSNGSRSRLWKVSLQQLANELRVIIRACHFPRALVNETRLSIACSARFRPTGGGSR